jgi:hypothetical protein
MYLPFAYLFPFITLIITNGYLFYKVYKVKQRKANLNVYTSINRRDTDMSNTFNPSSNNQQRHSNSSKYSDKFNIIRKMNHSLAINDDSKVSIMLISIVIFFCVCHFPSCILQLSIAFNASNNLYYYYSNTFANLLLSINLSFNFALYCLYGHKFRSTVRKIFLCSKQ